jgi:hypothetical protein
MPYTQWLPVAITLLLAGYCFYDEVVEYMANKKHKGPKVISTRNMNDEGPNYADDWEYSGWYGNWWASQDEVLADIKAAIENSKLLSTTHTEGVVNASAQ